MPQPLVTIIIPTYNRVDIISRVVESVLNQTYQNIELIVVDDGSTDGTKERLKVYKDKIKYIYKQNGGVCSARNVGIRSSFGEFVGLLDSDDQYQPSKIELCVKYLLSHEGFGLVHTAASFVNEGGKVLDVYSHPQSKFTGNVSDRLIMINYICNSTPLVTRKCFESAGYFDETIYAPADWDMWLRISEHYKIGYIDEPLTRYSVNSSSVFKALEKSIAEEEYVINKFFERNKGKPFLRRKAMSNCYARSAQCYVLKDDEARFKQYLTKAVAQNPLNYKAIGLLAYYSFNRQALKSILAKKILRN